MLYLVNEDLFSYDILQKENAKNGKIYASMRILTSNKLLKYPDARNPKEGGVISVRDRQNGIKVNYSDARPLNREIIRVSAPAEMSKEFTDKYDNAYSLKFDYPITTQVTYNNGGYPMIDVKCHEDGPDKSSLYVIAFPFNGMMEPIAPSKQYRIYKGYIASSVRFFYINNHRYRKVLYLVVSVDPKQFDSESKYYTEEIKIPLESYAFITDRASKEILGTTHEQMTVTIHADGSYETDWAFEEIDDIVTKTVDRGQLLWHTYNFNERPNKDNFKKNSNNKGSRPVHMEGGVMVTTNKHGIRKEIPVNTRNNNDYKNSKPKTAEENDFEAMLRQFEAENANSYKNSESENYNWKKNNGKGKGKKNNRRKNYDDYDY